MERKRKAEYIYDPIQGFIHKTKEGHVSSNDIRFQEMSPFFRALLVTDGTVTKLLEAYMWEPISIEKLLQKEFILKYDIPLLDVKKGEPIVLRKVLLRGVNTRKVYAFAESLIQIHLLEKGIQQDLIQGQLGMGELLRDRRLETYREILEFGEEKAGEEVSAHFEIKKTDPIYFRRYRINVGSRFVILITEKFYEPHFH